MRPADAEFDVLIQTSGMTEQMRKSFWIIFRQKLSGL